MTRRVLEGFFDEGGKDALAAALREVEAASSAEIVIAVRRSSGSYLDANLVVGILAATVTLAIGLFSPWPFSLEWLLLDPILVGIACGWLATYLPAVRRLATRPAEQARRVDVHARALFVERGVVATSGRTGMLVYVSLLERAARVVADSGVTAAVPAAEWATRVEEIQRAARRSKATAVARAIAALGPTLAPHLPHSDDDVNELPDEVSGP